MAVECRECEAPMVDNALFCEHCGAKQYPDLARPSSVAVPETVADPWVPHLLRTVGVGMLLAVAWITFIVGLLWRMHVLDVTGYRKRDVLWLWVPVVGNIAEVRTLWRYTARDVYWEPRDDRPSATIQGGARSAAIAGGWVLGPVTAAASIGAWIVWDDTAKCIESRMRRDIDAIESRDEDADLGDVLGSLGDSIEECDPDFDR